MCIGHDTAHVGLKVKG